MINIKNYIKESIFDNPEEIAKIDIKVQPNNRYELNQIIKDEVKKYKPGETVDLNFIDTSKIIDMSHLFNDIKLNKFNYNVSDWNVSNVVNMINMFFDCKKLNCDLSKWDVSNVKYMSGMFLCCENFNGDLFNWKLSKVKYMILMFKNCNKFEGNGLETWSVSNVRDMSDIFKGCTSLKKIPNWYDV